MTYSIHFDFDAEGEPPAVHIWQDGEGDILEVYEEPTCKLGGKLVEKSRGIFHWQGPWSWDEEDWEPGPLARRILELLSAEMVE